MDRLLIPEERPAIAGLPGIARSLIPSLREREHAAELARSLRPETVADLRSAGLFTLLQPARYGGHAGDLADFLAVAQQIGRGSCSAAWIYGNVALHNWIMGMFPHRAQEDLWGANPHAIVSSCLRPAGGAERVEGGYRIKGRWPYVSGCDHTGWSIVGGLVRSGAERPAAHLFLVPRSDYAILDTWQVNGLAATGSKDVIIDDAFVPEHRVLSVASANAGTTPGRELDDTPLLRVPLFSSFSFFLSGPIVGMAWGAVDQFIAHVKERSTAGGVAGGGEVMSSLPTIQLRVGEALMRLDAASATLDQAARNTMALAASEQGVQIEQRMQNRRAQCFATRLAVEAVDVLYEATGAGGIFLADPIQRIWRDIHVGAKHFSLNWDAMRAMCGQHALGIDPTLKMF